MATVLIGIALLTGCVAVSSSAHQSAAGDAPSVFITSARVVYAQGQPIDLTFSIATPREGEVVPAFEVVNEQREASEALQVGGRFLWETPAKPTDGKERSGATPPAGLHSETIADLRQWYVMNAPGNYRITFAGEWIDADGERHALGSNTILVRITRPPSEDEPLGELTESQLIPLSDIWALGMPGAKPLAARIDTGGFRPLDCDLVSAIVRRFTLTEAIRHPVGEAFVARGTELEALRTAHSVLVEQSEPEDVFRRGEDVWLFFFTNCIADRVLVEGVTNFGTVIEISYALVHTGQPASRVYMAMVPLRLDHVGRVEVQMRPSISGFRVPPYLPKLIHRGIAQPSSFHVVE